MSFDVQSLTSLNPFSIGIELVGDILGLPPEVKNVAKIALGAATGNPILLVDGVAGLAKNVREVAETEWVPPRGAEAGEGYASASGGGGGADAPATTKRSGDRPGGDVPNGGGSTGAGGTGGTGSTGGATGGAPAGLSQDDLEYYQAVDALFRNKDKFDTAGWNKVRDGIISIQDLRAVASDPNAPEEIRHAAGYFLDHPERLTPLMHRQTPYGGGHGVIGLPSLNWNAVADAVRQGEKRGAYDGVGAIVPAPATGGGSTTSSAGGAQAGGAGGVTVTTTTTTTTQVAVTTSTTTTTSVSQGQQQVRDIMSDPNLTPMEKLEKLLLSVADAAENEALELGHEIEDLQKKQRGVDANSKEGQEKAQKLQQDLERVTLRMQKLIERRSQMMALVTNISRLQHESLMRFISNVR